jgi:hypothetical protein
MRVSTYIGVDTTVRTRGTERMRGYIRNRDTSCSIAISLCKFTSFTSVSFAGKNGGRLVGDRRDEVAAREGQGRCRPGLWVCRRFDRLNDDRRRWRERGEWWAKGWPRHRTATMNHSLRWVGENSVVGLDGADAEGGLVVILWWSRGVGWRFWYGCRW